MTGTRNPERTVRVGGEHMVISPSTDPPFILDLEGRRRVGPPQAGAPPHDLYRAPSKQHCGSS